MAGRRALFGSRRRSIDHLDQRRGASSDFDDLRRMAEDQGWRVERTKSGHWKFVPPDPRRRIVVTGSTPSDHRAIRNFVADLRREGLRL